MTPCALLIAAALSAGNAEFDRQAAEGAAVITLQRVKENLKTKGPASGFLKAAMLADPARFAGRETAAAVCRTLYADAALKTFRDEAAALRARLKLRAESLPDLTAADRDAVAALFEAAFDRERKAACAEQAAGLLSATRPDEADFDTKTDETLRREMLDRILHKQKTPVFEENRRLVSERLVEPVLQAARREQHRQSEYLMRARSDVLSPAKLADDLHRRLVDNVAERRAKAADPATAWGVFEKTFSRAVAPAVERRTIERLVRKIEAADIRVSDKDIAHTISRDPSQHVKIADSEKIFADRYAADLIGSSLDALCAEAPADERAALRDYLSPRRQDARIEKAVRALVRKDVLPKWRKARAQVAAGQFKKIWPSFNDRTWYPPADVADSLVARSDYAKAVRRWRELDVFADLAAAGGTRMEEVDHKADRSVADAFDRARNAIAAQNAIVDGVYQPVRDEARRRRDAFWKRTPDLNAIVQLLTAATEKAWEETRLATLWPDVRHRPANAGEQHRALFPSVRRKIDLLARAILKDINEPSDKKPSSDETPEEQLEMFSIVVKRTGDTIEVALEKNGTSLISEKVPQKKNAFSHAMKKVSSRLSEVLKLK